jgi:hypothetical protein
MRSLPHSLDASVGLGDHPGKVGVGEVGQLTVLALQIAPQRLDQVQLGRVGGQADPPRRGLLPPEEALQLAAHAEVERAVEAQGEDLGAALA